MRLDPRIACANVQQRKLWAIAHDLFAHPLLVLTWYSRPAIWFHDWTSQHAWPRGEMAGLEKSAKLIHPKLGCIRVTETTPCKFYKAQRSRGFDHYLIRNIEARDLESAMAQAVEMWSQFESQPSPGSQP